MIAGAGPEQPPVPLAVTSNWGAIGSMAAAARAAASTDPKDVRIRELMTQLRDSTDKIAFCESRLTHREQELDRANTLVDDQAAQIVDLQGKLALQRGAPGRDEATFRRLQKIEAELRASLERAEARASQFQAALVANQIQLPNEHSWFRRNGTDASYVEDPTE